MVAPPPRGRSRNSRADPSETIECGEAHPEVRARLRGMLRRWREDVEAKVPEPNPEWEARRPRIPDDARD